jgi:Fe2+ transport system protein FeoA
MTLDKAAMDTPFKIVGFNALEEDDKLRLSALGVHEEAVITKLLHTPLQDPVECLVGPQLLTIDAWLLRRILVSAP